MAPFTSIPSQVEALLEQWHGSSRREFLRTSGRLAFTVAAAAVAAPFADAVADGQTPAGVGPYRDPDYKQLDSWIVIHQDNTATFYVGKTDMGQGTGTAFRQMMSDELDMPLDRKSTRLNSSHT